MLAPLAAGETAVQPRGTQFTCFTSTKSTNNDTPAGAQMRESIQKLDAEADMKLLRSTLALPEDSLLTLFIGTTLIKAAAANGLTLHETGMLMVREASGHHHMYTYRCLDVRIHVYMYVCIYRYIDLFACMAI